ncbi:MAG: aspartate aminotransferase family protein [Verrucomicrobiae bacterium]|nr:aspartate aminotransferase family protein [Verrucomicrobiae bacterium]
MTSAEVIELFDRYVMPTYARWPLVLVRGRGARVWDADGREYLDFGGGIAVNLLGHSAIADTVARAAQQLVHVSNLYYHPWQGELAKRLVELVGIPGKVFFCNSGAEANEAMIKLARRWGHDEGRYEIIVFQESFHGRTLAGITATGQDKVKKGFEPLVPGFRHVPFNDLDAVASAISPQTVAVLLEPIQGESGIRPAESEFLRGLRRLCDRHRLLLMYDEVQCGLGRTGDFCAWRTLAPEAPPDAMSWAKGLAGGFPMGAMWARAPYQDVLGPGTHASTFGGTPLACAVALAVLETVEREGLMENARALGQYLMTALRELPGVRDVRGRGLMIGVELVWEARAVLGALTEAGLLAVAGGTHVVRLLPPLNITRTEAEEAVAKFARALATLPVPASVGGG